MPADRKETIARAAMTLLMKKGVKKLTVKDIVEECHITSQAFYYHFEEIPEPLRWMIEKATDLALQETLAQQSAEDGLRSFFVMAINSMPYVSRGMNSNYSAELAVLLRQYIERFFAAAAEGKSLYAHRPPAEIKFILRYHCNAILGCSRTGPRAILSTSTR